MLDILQTIDNEVVQQRDPHGHMAELEKWSVHKAEAMAQEEGLTLTRDHWEVIHLLREHYRLHGPSSVRNLASGLEDIPIRDLLGDLVSVSQELGIKPRIRPSTQERTARNRDSEPDEGGE